MKLSEAFLSGRDASVIVKLDPERPWQLEGLAETVNEPADQREEIVQLLRDRDEVGALHRTKQIAEQLRQNTVAYATARLTDASFHQEAGAPNRKALYEPIVRPTLEALGPRMRQYSSAVATLMEYASDRVPDAVAPLVRIFEGNLPSGRQDVIGLPRFVAAVVGETLLAYAIALRKYPSFAAVSRGRFKGYTGVRPWVLAPEFHHLDSLGRDASVLGHVVLDHISREPAGEFGLTVDELHDAAIAADVLLGVLGASDSSRRLVFSWGFAYYGHRIEPTVRDIATDRDARAAIASVISEDADTFAAKFIDRYQAHVQQAQCDEPLDPSVLRLFTAVQP
jgi:hypothetical protein